MLLLLLCLCAINCIYQAIGREELDSLLFVSSNFTRARETAADCRAAVIRIASFEREVCVLSTYKSLLTMCCYHAYLHVCFTTVHLAVMLYSK
jgi:hypothetical protein